MQTHLGNIFVESNFLSTYVSTDDGKGISGYLDNKQKTHPKTQGRKDATPFYKGGI